MKKINTKVCQFCKFSMIVRFGGIPTNESGINRWCRNLNIPLFTWEKTVCDNYQQANRISSGNGYNFREVKEDV